MTKFSPAVAILIFIRYNNQKNEISLRLQFSVKVAFIFNGPFTRWVHPLLIYNFAPRDLADYATADSLGYTDVKTKTNFHNYLYVIISNCTAVQFSLNFHVSSGKRKATHHEKLFVFVVADLLLHR